jgi:hypothetical protein
MSFPNISNSFALVSFVDALRNSTRSKRCRRKTCPPVVTTTTTTPPPVVTTTTTTTPAPHRVIVRVYDYTHLNRDGAVRAAVEYYDAILRPYGYEWEYIRMPYMADGAACRASTNVTPLPGVKACETYDPDATIAASSVGRTWVDNGDGNWAIRSWFHIYTKTLDDPPVAGAGTSFHHHACHELGHIWGSLAHQSGDYPSCMNVTRWTINGVMQLWITEAEIQAGITKFPISPPPSATGSASLRATEIEDSPAPDERDFVMVEESS